jgi:hypothetical protein
MSKIIEVEGNKFDVEDYKDGFEFLSFMFNNEEYYSIFTNSLLKEFLNTNIEEYSKEFIANNSYYLIALLEIRTVFEPFVKDLNYNNIFYHFLIENPASDNVKIQQTSKFLNGLIKIIDYYNSFEIYSLDYLIGTKNINLELEKNKFLVYFIPSFIVFQQLKNLYDILWNDYEVFIDKNKFKYSLFYSNKVIKKEVKESREKKNEKSIHSFFINLNDKEQFLEELRNKFDGQKGISFKILVKLLEEENVLVIESRRFKIFYNASCNFFLQDIGSYASINDKYKHSVDEQEFYKNDIEAFSKKLRPLIIKYKINN